MIHIFTHKLQLQTNHIPVLLLPRLCSAKTFLQSWSEINGLHKRDSWKHWAKTLKGKAASSLWPNTIQRRLLWLINVTGIPCAKQLSEKRSCSWRDIREISEGFVVGFWRNKVFAASNNNKQGRSNENLERIPSFKLWKWGIKMSVKYSSCFRC